MRGKQACFEKYEDEYSLITVYSDILEVNRFSNRIKHTKSSIYYT